MVVLNTVLSAAALARDYKVAITRFKNFHQKPEDANFIIVQN